MKFDSLKENVSTFVGMTGLKIRAASPEICLGLGLATMAGAVVAGIMAAKNHDMIIADHEDRLAEAKAEVIISEDPESGEEVEVTREKKEIDREVRKVYVQTGFKMVKNYALTGALMAVSTAFFCEMHNIMGGRIAGLTGAYTGLQEYIRRYEDNNIKLNGEESHRMCKYGFKEVEIEEEDPDTGEVVKEKKLVPNEAADICEDPDLAKGLFHDHFAIFSRQTTPTWQSRSNANIRTLENAQNYIQDLVNSRGWAVVNEALVMLGLEPTLEGMNEGWVKGKGPKVDFGIENPVNNRALTGFNNEPVFLEFNVHGNVYTILKKKEEKDLQEKRVKQENGVLTYAGEPVSKKALKEFLAEG